MHWIKLPNGDFINLACANEVHCYGDNVQVNWNYAVSETGDMVDDGKTTFAGKDATAIKEALERVSAAMVDAWNAIQKKA